MESVSNEKFCVTAFDRASRTRSAKAGIIASPTCSRVIQRIYRDSGVRPPAGWQQMTRAPMRCDGLNAFAWRSSGRIRALGWCG